jgi:predicted DNA-binding transcriptional regulator YafY
MTFLTPYDDLFERWLVTFADHAEVVTPDSLKIKLKELVDSIQQRIS